MSSSSIPRDQAAGRLVLSCAAGAISLLASLGTAQAQLVDPIVTELSVRSPRIYQVGVGEQDTCPPPMVCPFEAVNRFQLVKFTGGPPAVWAAGQEGDAVFLEEGFTPATCPGWDTITNGVIPSCVSDVTRFVNVAGRAEIWFISDSFNPAVAAGLPNLPVNAMPATFLREATPPLTNTLQNKIVVTRNLTPYEQVKAYIGSDSLDLGGTVSDSLEIRMVPALSPAALMALGVLLVGLGYAFVARRRQGGGTAST